MGTHNIPFQYKHKVIPNLQLWDFFQVTQERVRTGRGKQVISVRATEGLLFLPHPGCNCKPERVITINRTMNK